MESFEKAYYSSFPIWTNNFARYFSAFFLVSHFPCSYRCESTISASKRLVSALEEKKYLFLPRLMKDLSSLVIVTSEDGILNINDYYIYDLKIEYSYESIKTTNENSELYYYLIRSNSIFFDNEKGRLSIKDKYQQVVYNYDFPFSLANFLEK